MHPISLFESVFNSSPIGNYLLSPRPEAIILAVNDAFLAASSRTRQELIGISLFEAFPGDPNDPEDTGEVNLRRSLARVLETGKRDIMPAQRYPIRVEMPDGEVRFEERFWNAENTPIFDRDGQILCISHTTRDVTEQIRASLALQESERRYRALTTATADVVYRMNPDWSQMRELEGRGFLKDTPDPRPLWLDEYIPLEEQDRMHRTITAAIESRSVFELEHQVRRLDGTTGWTISRAIPLFDDDGKLVEWIGAASDITERKESEEQLRLADRRKDEFLAMLAHELRNPLAPVRAAADLLQSTTLDEARMRQTSQIIGRQVAYMTQLIDDLLDVSRVTRGKITLANEALDIRQVLADAVEQVTPLIQNRRHHLALHLPPDTSMVHGDRKRLVQVVANILNNAAKYTPPGGRISLSTEVQDERILIDVADNGIGMTPEISTHAFELFSQAERGSDRTSGGLGLGLALVKSLVELHRGSVTCESEGIGQGSRFTVCLPRLLTSSSSDEAKDANDTLETRTPLRIMVVDDNADAATMIALLLEASGHRVQVEHFAHKALERSRQNVPDVFLLDIGLPDMDGNELARRLRAQPETADAALVAITGYGQDSDRERAFEAGFNHHLVKPVDIRKLSAILTQVSEAK